MKHMQLNNITVKDIAPVCCEYVELEMASAIAQRLVLEAQTIDGGEPEETEPVWQTYKRSHILYCPLQLLLAI